MSYVVAVPEFVASAASDLSNIGSGLSVAHAVAALAFGRPVQRVSIPPIASAWAGARSAKVSSGPRRIRWSARSLPSRRSWKR